MLLVPRKDGARASPYAARVDIDEQNDEVLPEPKQIAKALGVLMRWKDWNQSDLARESGVSQRHISDVLRGLSDCTTEMAEQLAAPFGMRAWQLMLPDLTEELLTSTNLKIIFETYLKHPGGRKLIDGAAEMVRGGA